MPSFPSEDVDEGASGHVLEPSWPLCPSMRSFIEIFKEAQVILPWSFSINMLCPWYHPEFFHFTRTLAQPRNVYKEPEQQLFVKSVQYSAYRISVCPLDRRDFGCGRMPGGSVSRIACIYSTSTAFGAGAGATPRT